MDLLLRASINPKYILNREPPRKDWQTYYDKYRTKIVPYVNAELRGLYCLTECLVPIWESGTDFLDVLVAFLWHHYFG